MTSDDTFFENQHIIWKYPIPLKRQSNSLTPKRKGMAQEKIPNEKTQTTRKPKAGSDALPVEQITELMLVHNKNDPKFGVQAVSEIDKDGKAKTVPADEKNENSFLKFDKNSSILENFIKNFWSQLKEPTHFRLLRMTYHDYKVNKQAIRDLSEGKQNGCGERVPQTLRNPSERKQEGTKCKPKRKTSYGRQRDTTAGTPATVAKYSRRHSNSSSPRLNRQRRSRKDRVTGIMRTWSTGRSWKRSESQRLRWNSRDSLIPC